MKRFFLAAALTVLGSVPVSTIGLLIAAPPLAAQPTDFGQGTQIGRVESLPKLPSSLQPLYNTFRNEVRYFAAFAVHFEKEKGFFIQNFHDAGRARAAALEGCRLVAQASGCVIYAVAMPESLPVDQSKASGLSELAASQFNMEYSEHRDAGTYAAFAISGASHEGYGYNYTTAADAKDTAIAYCQIGVARDMAELGPDARKFARARGWQHCKVVDVRFTSAD